jgi:hypothetical protein
VADPEIAVIQKFLFIDPFGKKKYSRNERVNIFLATFLLLSGNISIGECI